MKRVGLFVLLFVLAFGTAFGEEAILQKITVLGNVKIEEGVIRQVIKSREGQPFSAEQVREDLRSIFRLGYFADVQVDIRTLPEGRELIFIVVEKPTIKEVLIVGNDKVKLEDIKEKVTVQPRGVVNLEKVNESVEQIRKLYFSKGYYGVKVEPKVEETETHEAIVTFQIEEGPKGRIQKIIFTGNQKMKSSELRKVMMTKQWNLFSFITKAGVLDEDTLKNDLQLLSAYYFDHGYLEAKISEPKIDLSDPKRLRIEINVSEGPQYRVADIDFRGDVLTTREALFETIKLKRNDVYSISAVRADIARLTELFANQGYAYVEVSPDTAVDPKTLTVNVTFEIEKKKRVQIEKIQITGNTKTRDKVIRREVQVAEGELYSAAALNESRNRLRRLGFFKEVGFSTSRGSTDEKINLDIKVEEAPTGALSFGVGYSSLYKVLGTVSVSDRNLFGMGYEAVARMRLGVDSREFRLSFTDPYFLGYPYSLGTNLYHEQVGVFDTYSYKVTGGDLHAGKELSPSVRLNLTYKLETVNVYDVSSDASRLIKEQEGKSTTSAITATLTRDTRDDYFAPTQGWRQSLLASTAGSFLGGDNDFVKGVLDLSWYHPLPLNMVLNLRGRMGIIEPYGGTKAPINERFFVGGGPTIRGFEYGKAGPLDEFKEPLGATKMIVGNVELIFPLAREIGLRGALFWDIGKGFNKMSDLSPIKTGVGVGLRWFSPFGPINIDIGFNPNPKKGEKTRVIDLNAGTTF